jgi:hypothetical protein
MVNAAKAVGRAVSEYADSAVEFAGEHVSDPFARAAANEEMRQFDLMRDSQQMRTLQRDLERAGKLPTLLLNEMKYTGDNRLNDEFSGPNRLSKNEVKTVLENSSQYDPTTVLAAKVAADHWDEIRTSDGANDFDSSYLTISEIKTWSDKTRSTRHESVDKVFSDESAGAKDRGRRKDNSRRDVSYADDIRWGP